MNSLRFQNTLRFARGTISRPGTPCTFLIPATLREDLERILAQKGYTMSRYVRILVRKYRATCLSYGVPQSGGVKRRYQEPGLQQARVSFRIENEIWVELGQIAAFLGMSRCYLFAWLLKLEAAGGAERYVGVPTNGLEAYDVNYPAYIEYSERVYLYQNRYDRKLKLQPCAWRGLPSNLRLDYIKNRRTLKASAAGGLPSKDESIFKTHTNGFR